MVFNFDLGVPVSWPLDKRLDFDLEVPGSPFDDDDDARDFDFDLELDVVGSPLDDDT